MVCQRDASIPKNGTKNKGNGRCVQVYSLDNAVMDDGRNAAVVVAKLTFDKSRPQRQAMV